jgi:hypothetical protein
VADLVAAGTWVEISTVVLEPARRAPRIPEDTKRLPLEMRVKGFLAAPVVLGDRAEIITAARRKLGGILTAVNPPYSHGFGAPIPELSAIGGKVRALLRARGQNP